MKSSRDVTARQEQGSLPLILDRDMEPGGDMIMEGRAWERERGAVTVDRVTRTWPSKGDA